MKETYNADLKIQDVAKTDSVDTTSTPTVDDVINQINIDSRQQPEEYVDDIDIPGGGE